MPHPPLERSRVRETKAEIKTRLHQEAALRRPLGWRLEMQGKRLTLKRTGTVTTVKPEKGRGDVTTFSRRARAARLRRIAEVDWAKTGESYLITFTYPDPVADHTMEERKQHRYQIHREIENQAGRHVGCFWRVEWMPRQSGARIGQVMPHMHFLYLSCPDLDEKRTREVWMRVIHAPEYTQVDFKRVPCADAAGVYVSKYCSKESNPLVLDYVPKRNKTGRHAGELRKKLIPVHAREVVAKISDAIVRMLRQRACETLWWYDPRFDEGFTILGDVASELQEDARIMLLDEARRKVV